MKKYIRLFLIIAFSTLLFNCGSTKENGELTKLDIPPDHAQIIGEIINIEPISDDPDTETACSMHPCIAKVKVKSAKYGSSFPQLAKDQEIRIKFNFTLDPTNKEMFPEMTESFPGLNEGDKFIALVSHVQNIDPNTPDYQIYGYELR